MYKIINQTIYNILFFPNLFICALLAIPISLFGIPIGIYNVFTNNTKYKIIIYGILASFTIALPIYYWIAFMTLFEYSGSILYKLLIK
jgi:hypothetical protein